jgi:hypothetical protein
VTTVLRKSATASATGRIASGGHSEVLERRAQQAGQSGLRQVADGQIGQRDPDLCAGQLCGQRPQCSLHPTGTGLVAFDGPVDRAPVDRDQGELRRHEDPAGEHEGKGQEQQ